ncbi:phosphoenolpyruvate mutase [Pseudooceanicola sp.]|uniref:phosphoenolpyruvate mutase n=1 Tax=Pseudooceanicola sp. TaxID=1914328 RepID=UPI0026079B60|nr:phosphoenolpyruvate mutase [Pseudooceanicola sp.]MDF1854409.1 phosphoenolpyruvate mutase [Pseudooceanicola sp.]
MDVFVSMTMEILHSGHLKILKEAKKLGHVTVGLLTDGALENKKPTPLLSYEQREEILNALEYVDAVIPQTVWDYGVVIDTHKPAKFVHGDKWDGPLEGMRERALDRLAQYGGQLVEFPYSHEFDSSRIAPQMAASVATPYAKQRAFRRMLQSKGIIRILEAHSPLAALIGEHMKVERGNGDVLQFDGFWSSSLTDSTEMGLPDIEALDVSRRLQNIDEIFEVTTKPLIMDADTGGKAEHFELKVRTMERMGIAAAIIEDKTGLKKNSLLGNDVPQTQASIPEFCEKISAGIEGQKYHGMMVIARLESLILGRGIDDALTRADAYVKAGAGAVMIHSREKEPDEIFAFTRQFMQAHPTVPIVAVPSSYNQVYDHELQANGIKMVIYANHMLRASYKAMEQTARSILEHGRTAEVEDDMISISQILKLIPGTV